MRGELIPVWPELWAHVWEPLSEYADAPADLFSELYREQVQFLVQTPRVEELADAVNDPVRGRDAMQGVEASDFPGELAVMAFLESAFGVLEDIGGDGLSNCYFVLLQSFLDRFSIRYDLRRPCVLCPTLPGIFARLMYEVRQQVATDAALSSLLRDFDDSVRDLRRDPSDVRVRTVIQRQVNLLEGLASRHPDARSNTLGALCNEISSWPHDAVRQSAKRMNDFANDYPGIRHAGSPDKATRPIDMRDLVAVSVVLAGFSPYLSASLQPGAGYDVG